SEGMCYGDRILSVGVSIGIAQSIPGKDTLEDVLRRADRALYHAKSSGRSRYCWSNDEPLPERASA
ncbi:MAG: diguanylate cyclase, partial [Hyphomicrobium sp.]|uniref:diguanylate cyclase domain-containing protein n=1 Tax=Hyphomicrobium sp. TaxID=82 RepID=UPI003D0AD610